jgi:hypothetical protein
MLHARRKTQDAADENMQRSMQHSAHTAPYDTYSRSGPAASADILSEKIAVISRSTCRAAMQQ